MKKFLGIVIFIAAIIFAGWAYMNSGTPIDPLPSSDPSPSPVQTTEPSPEVVVTSSPEPKEEKLTANAVYSGRADSNFIEIIVDGKYISAKLSPELKASFDSLDIEEEDSVTIEYTLEKGIYIVHKLSKK